jgi:hypothetical protein
MIAKILLLTAVALTQSAAKEPDKLASDKRALAVVQSYVGEWRGVGQLRRGSNQGAWTEQSDWAWHFAEGRATLVGTNAGSKYFSKLQLMPGDKQGELVLLATPAGEGAAPLKYVGSATGGKWTFVASDAAEGQPARITMQLVAGGDRLVMLLEKKLGDGVYTRLAEIGATRKGSSFATKATAGPECVVTGGLGTIAVEYEGKKYFVCCTGCRDLFNEDPAGVLADYRARKAEEAAGKKP